MYPLNSRPLQILQVNRQIHFEASSLLYSRLLIRLKPTDFTCLQSRSDVVCRTQGRWKHNPLRGLGRDDGKGSRFYESPARGTRPENHRWMEPHVFSQLQRFEFKFEIAAEKLSHSSARICEHLFTAEENRQDFLQYWPFAKFFRTMAKVFGKSVRIQHLTIILSAYVRPFCDGINCLSAMRSNRWCIPTSETSISRLNETEQLAVELFLISRGLEPLCVLETVKNFDVKLQVDGREDRAYCYPEPQQDALNVIKHLKETVEGNWRRKNQDEHASFVAGQANHLFNAAVRV